MVMADFITCTTGAVVPTGAVTEDNSDQSRLQAMWSVLEAVNPGVALTFQIQYEKEMVAFAELALHGTKGITGADLVDLFALTQQMVSEIRLVLPPEYDFAMNRGVLGIWRKA